MKSPILKQKLKSKQGEIPESLSIRVHRAISWLKCAEENHDKLDIHFITLWIAYNACYSVDEKLDTSLSEKDRFGDFVSKLVSHDAEGRIFNLLWNKFSGPVRLLIENEYLYKPFWDFHRGQPVKWKKLHYQSILSANKFLANREVDSLLCVVLQRLYVLRNQLVHGGATCNSKVNRVQLKDACNIQKLLVPIIIDIMLDNGEEDWGDIYYPVIDPAK